MKSSISFRLVLLSECEKLFFWLNDAGTKEMKVVCLQCSLMLSEDGSGRGAALVAAVAVRCR